MQTILGAGGAIANLLAEELTAYTTDIRLVSRNPQKINPGDELMAADLLDPDAVDKAVAGSQIVYLTVGFPYSLKVWKESWPWCMENVIQACARHKAKLVFFDNIYMYDKAYLKGMKEDTPINPPSQKGQVRALVLNMIMKAINEGSIEALIARCADYYGPGVQGNGILRSTVIDPLSKGQTANWLGDPTKQHAFTYIQDAAKGTALLGNTPEAYGETWHLPTAGDPPTGKEWVDLFADAFGSKPKVRRLSGWMLKLVGIFIPVMKEMPEMQYQYNTDYIFDSSKFEKRFNFKPTPYATGVLEVLEKDFPE